MAKTTATHEAQRDLPVAVWAPTGRDQALIERVLGRAGLSCIGCGEEGQLLSRVNEDSGPLIVAEEGLSPAGKARLIERLKAQPDWSELPVILLARGASRGISHLADLVNCGGVRVLRRPLDSDALLAMVRMAVEARQRQLDVGDLLRALERMNQRLQRRSEQLQQLTVQLAEAEDNERKRLAQLLHDDLQQLLVGAGLQLRVAQKQAGDNLTLQQTLAEAREVVEQAQQQSRDLSHELFPAILHQATPGELLHWLRDHARQTLSLEVALEIDGDLGAAGQEMVRFLYRVVRELLCNTAKHAGVTEARIEARRAGQRIELVISDEGKGFDPEAIEEKHDASNGIGLQAVRERVAFLGAQLAIDSRPGEGARFRLSLPVQSPVSSQGVAVRPVPTIEIRSDGASQPLEQR